MRLNRLVILFAAAGLVASLPWTASYIGTVLAALLVVASMISYYGVLAVGAGIAIYCSLGAVVRWVCEPLPKKKAKSRMDAAYREPEDCEE